MPKPRNSVISFLLILTGCYLVSFFGAEAAFKGLPVWYPSLQKPSWTPPAWVFAPVWTILYGMMGTAAWLVYRDAEAPRSRRTVALAFFVLQLILNGLWSWIFFAWQNLPLATLEIGLLWVLILVTLVLFARIRGVAAGLLVPYLLWVTFASVLTYSIQKLNPPVPKLPTLGAPLG